MELSKELVKKLKNDPNFIEFSKYIVSKVEELNSLGGLSDLSNERAGEEVKARTHAISKLTTILQPIIEFSEKNLPTEDDYKKAAERFGL